MVSTQLQGHPKKIPLQDKPDSRFVTDRSNSPRQTLSKSTEINMQGIPLSTRELDVLACLARGLTTNQIGKTLFISENTVKTHVRHILEKLEALNRTDAVIKAVQKGLIKK